MSLVPITQPYFYVTKTLTKICILFHHENPNKREIQQIQTNHSLDIDLKDFMNLYEKCSAKQYCSLANDTTLASDNLLHFKCNLLERT